ncbi:MAG: G5 domain-containing protein [Arcanobacterium sp.]|nr:G5 domain-containing protein [Arcanobacterium sp.]MDY5588450.1 G5 domain-containing protein [Arcanobacterium sp.]
MGKHSVRAAGDSAELASVLEEINREESSSSYRGVRRALREAQQRADQEPVAPTTLPLALCVTPSASVCGADTNYAEYMNESLVAARVDSITVEAPRRFTGLFSRSRVATAALVTTMLGVSGAAMAATGSPVPVSKVAAVQADNAASQTQTADKKIAVENTVSISVTVGGTAQTITAREGYTVGEALSEAGIYLGANDEVSVSLSAPVKDGMKIAVARVTTKTVTEPFTAPFTTREEQTSELDKGKTKTVQEGVNGAGMRTATVYYRDGKEFKREVQLETITQAPKDKVVQVGTRVAAPSPSAPGGSAAPRGTVSGTKTEWMAAAGIPQSDWGYVDYIVSRESGWNPSAYNGSSGACSLVQALPCSKLGPNWNDPVVALQWQHGYVNSRYGGYAGAYNFWVANGWY